MPSRTLATNRVGQWRFVSRKDRQNPFAEVEVDVIVTGPGGRSWRLPAFWAGDKGWRFRFAAPKAGTYTFLTECSDRTDAGLHDRQGTFRAVAYKGENRLVRTARRDRIETRGGRSVAARAAVALVALRAPSATAAVTLPMATVPPYSRLETVQRMGTS